MFESTQTKDAHGRLKKTRDEIEALASKRNGEGKYEWSTEEFERWNSLQKQLPDEVAEFKKWEAIDLAAKANKEGLDELGRPRDKAPFGSGRRNDEGEPRRVKSVGEQFAESKAYQISRDSGWNIDAKADFAMPTGLVDYKGNPIDSEYKTTMSTSAGFAPFVVRSNDVVPYAFRRVMVPQLMPSITTTENSIQYMEETTRTVATAAKLESSALAEGAIAYTLRTVNIEDIGEYIPVTERQLADAPQVAGLINNSLLSAVDRTVEDEILTGSGTSPHLVGFLGAAASSVQTQALGTDSVVSAIMKGITKVNHTGYAEASAVVMHPNDYQDMILLQDSTGRYIFGDPASTAVRTVWGLPTIVTTGITENTALVGDFATYAYTANRQEARVEMGWISTNFVDRVRTLRAYKRVALVIRRQTAFCKVTGI